MHIVLRVIQIEAVEPWPRLAQFDQRLQVDAARFLYALAERDVLAVRQFAATQIQVGHAERLDRLQLALQIDGDYDEFDAPGIL